MISAPAQRKLPLVLDVTKPLVSLETAAAHLGGGVDVDDVLLLLEAQTADAGPALDWCWNIGSKRAARAERRILTDCLRCHLSKEPQPARTWEQVLALVLPHDKASDELYFSARRLLTFWSAGADLALDLIRERELRTFEGTKWHRGRGGEALVSRASAVEFLKRRRIE